MKKRIWLILTTVILVIMGAGCEDKEGEIAFSHELQWENAPISVEAHEPAATNIYPGQVIKGWYKITNPTWQDWEIAYKIDYPKEKFENLLTLIGGTFTYQQDESPPVTLEPKLLFPGSIEVDPDGDGPKIPWPYVPGKMITLEGKGVHLLYITLVIPDNWESNADVNVDVSFKATPRDTETLGSITVEVLEAPEQRSPPRGLTHYWIFQITNNTNEPIEVVYTILEPQSRSGAVVLDTYGPDGVVEQTFYYRSGQKALLKAEGKHVLQLSLALPAGMDPAELQITFGVYYGPRG